MSEDGPIIKADGVKFCFQVQVLSKVLGKMEEKLQCGGQSESY